MDEFAQPRAPAETVLHETRFRDRNRNIQWLRAAAALAVVVYHLSAYQSFLFKDPQFARVFNGQFGLLGVAVFFTISGALMADILVRTDPHRFLAHRLVRIYPLFIAASLIVPLMRTGGLSIDPATLTLFPLGDLKYGILVAWTLIFEIVFYVLLFFVSIAGLRRHLDLIAVGWLVVILIGAFVLPRSVHKDLKSYLPILPFITPATAFVIGLLVPRAVRLGWFQPASIMVALAALLVGLAAPLVWQRVTIAVVAFVVVGLATAGADNIRAVSPGKGPQRAWMATVMTRLGDYSYALYLVHASVVIVVYRNAATLSHPVLWLIGLVAALIVSIPIGILDVRAYRITRRWADAVPHHLLVAFNTIYLILFFGLSLWYFAASDWVFG